MIKMCATFTVVAAVFATAASANAASFVIDASAATTVTVTAAGVVSSQYNIVTQSNQAASTYTSSKSTQNQYDLDWYSAAAISVSTRRTYFTNNGVTLGSLQYFAQTYGGFGPTATPWVNGMVAFYTDQQDSAGLPPQDIPQINFVEVAGDYQVPEFTAANGMSLTIRFGLPGAGPGGPGGGGPSPVPAVPEPATWALMLMGFGLVGLALRRRRKRVAIAL